MTQVLDTLGGKTIAADTSADGHTVTVTAAAGATTSTLLSYTGSGNLSLQFLEQAAGDDIFLVKETVGNKDTFHLYETNGLTDGTYHLMDFSQFTDANTVASTFMTLNGLEIINFYTSSYADTFFSVDVGAHQAYSAGVLLVGSGKPHVLAKGDGYILLVTSDKTQPYALQTNGIDWFAQTGRTLDLSQRLVTLGDGNDVFTVDGKAPHTVHGGNGDDVLTGNENGDSLFGDGGNDTLYGQVGDDTLYGGDGNDYLHDYFSLGNEMHGGVGGDTLVGAGIQMSGEDGNDFISVNGQWAQADETVYHYGHSGLYGGAGDDTLQGDTGAANTLSGGVGNDVYYVYRSDDVLSESLNEGFDTVYTTADLKLSENIEAVYAVLTDATHGFQLTGNSLGNVIEGNLGNDTLKGMDGNDTLFGDGGNDSIDGGKGNDSIDVGTNDLSTLTGGDGNDTIHGSGTLDGGIGNDVLYGNANINQFTGGAGNDEIHAYNTTNPGAINDHVHYSGNLSDYSVIRDTGSDHTLYVIDDRMGSPDGVDTISGYADLVFADQTFTPTAANSGFAVFDGTAALNGGAFADWLREISGSSIVHGNAGNDIIEATGSATINAFGDAGDDWITGGIGNDSLQGNDGNDTLSGNGGADSLNGGKGDDSLDGGDGNDTLTAADGRDSLWGRAGNDSLDGGTGADTMHGGAGDDIYVVDNVGDVVSEQTVAGIDDGGNDHVYASVSFRLGGGLEALTLTGSSNIDGTGNNQQNNIYGNSGNNTLSGSGGDDKLKGGAGNDTLIGGAGNDWLEGGSGADKFVFSQSVVNGTDRIQDFEHGVDKLVFTTFDFFTSAHFTVGSVASGSGAQFIWDETTHILSYDIDGAGGTAAIAIALFTNGAHIDASDILFA